MTFKIYAPLQMQFASLILCEHLNKLGKRAEIATRIDKNDDQVWIRDKNDHSHPIIGGGYFQNAETSICFGNVTKIKDWCGFSFNPSVRRLSKWKAWFPNGIAGKDEIELSRQLKDNYKAVSLAYPSIRHIGGGRHSKGFKI